MLKIEVNLPAFSFSSETFQYIPGIFTFRMQVLHWMNFMKRNKSPESIFAEICAEMDRENPQNSCFQVFIAGTFYSQRADGDVASTILDHDSWFAILLSGLTL